jgi:hypothetical protein
MPLFFEFIGVLPHHGRHSVLGAGNCKGWKHALASCPRKATSIKQLEPAIPGFETEHA